jgi:hypothetical protein
MWIVLFIVILLLLLVLVMWALSPSNAPKPKPHQATIEVKMLLRADGEVAAVTDGVFEGAPLRFEGLGALATPDLVMEYGWYAVRWAFPHDNTFQLKLFNTAPDGDDIYIDAVSGNGEKGFFLNSTGRYVLIVEPLNNPETYRGHWILRLGRIPAADQRRGG